MKYKLAFKKDVKAVARELKTQFYLQEYSLTYIWHEQDQEKDGRKTIASVPIDDVYLTYRLNIYPALQKMWEEDKDDFFEVLVHEHSHVLTEPLYNIAINGVTNREQEWLEEVRERQTQRISVILTPFLKQLITKNNGRNKSRRNKNRRSK